MTDPRMRRAFLAGALTPGARMILDPDESHHASRVLRLRPGDTLLVFDGAGGEWDATIETVTSAAVGVVLGAAREAIAEPSVGQRIIDQGGFPQPGKPAEFAKFIESEVKVWGDIIRTANVTLPD